MTMTAAAAMGVLLAVGVAAEALRPGHWLNPVAYIRSALNPGGSSLADCGGSSCWGVIVEKNGGVFARVKETSQQEAETGAMDLCARRAGGAGGCRVIAVVSKKECWALAEMATNRNNWRGAPGVTLDEAKSFASSDCERSYGICRVDVTFCADGSQRLGGTD